MTLKSLSILFLSLVLLMAGPAVADQKAHEYCQHRVFTINPSDTQTNDPINISTGLIGTPNATWATAYATVDTFLTNVPLTFSKLKAFVDVAPGTTGGTDTRSITVAWDPPGATPLQNSQITGTTPSTRGGFGCTITGTATSCTSASNRGVLVPTGSTVAIRVNMASSPSAPDTAAELGISFCATPTNVVGLN